MRARRRAGVEPPPIPLVAYYDDGTSKARAGRVGWFVYQLNRCIGGPYEVLSAAAAAHPDAVRAKHAQGPA